MHHPNSGEAGSSLWASVHSMNQQQIEFPRDHAGDLLSELESCSRIEAIDNIRYFINEFWTSRQRQAHRIHEVSYRACFKPQLPAFFIERLSRPGDLVYDPFMGRGTTPIEAALQGRKPYGNDINPLSQALVEPRLNPPSLTEIDERLASIPWRKFNRLEAKELLAFYHPKTLAQILGLRNWLLERQKSNELDKIDKWIRMVSINRLTGHSTGFFSVYTLPPNQAMSVERQTKLNRKRQQVPPIRDIPLLISKKSKSLLSHHFPKTETGVFFTEFSHSTPQIPDKCITLSVTSPPFLDVVDYVADNWLRCWFLGINASTVQISQYRSVKAWQNFISKTLTELVRITKTGGHIAFEVGEVRRNKIKLERHVIDAAKGLPLEILGVMINQQLFTKTSNCWGVSNNQRGTNSNRIVLFRKQRC